MAEEQLPAREMMECDVVVVGAGPAGLAAAIRLKQLSPEINIVVLEKGSEVGAHILSGAVIDPIGIDRLLPGWRTEDSPIRTPVTDDRFYWLGRSAAVRLPNWMMPPLMSNHGNYIVSLGNVCRWLAGKAEALGVEIYPGFAATEVLTENSVVVGVATGDMGIGKDGNRKPGFTRGMELRAKYTLFAEGARGNLSKTLIAKFGLDQGCQPQKFGLGLKELWQVAPDNHRPGLVQHSSVGRSTIVLEGARFSTTSMTTLCRLASWCISTTKTRTLRRSKNFSALRPTRWCVARSRVRGGSPMEREPLPRADTSRFRGSRSLVAR
jgi:electron-transferring-flavoprotein dehydrogenase